MANQKVYKTRFGQILRGRGCDPTDAKSKFCVHIQ